MNNEAIAVLLFTIACFSSSFVSTMNSRAKNSNSILLHGIFGVLADILWLFLFKELIARNVLGIHEMVFYPGYIIGYGIGKILAQWVYIKYFKGKASVGGVKELEQRVKLLEERGNSDAVH